MLGPNSSSKRFVDGSKAGHELKVKLDYLVEPIVVPTK